jgi:hypothetical protein
VVAIPSPTIAATTTDAAQAVPASTTYAIQGTVTGTGGTLLQNIQVVAYSSDYGGSAYTGTDGTYSVPVPAGTYTIGFYDYGGTYLNGWYSIGSSGNFSIDSSSATSVTVNSSDVPGISVQLGTGHYIEGTITGTGGALLGNINVEALSTGYTGYAKTDLSGEYSVDVPAGTYTAYFIDNESGTYLAGYYNGPYGIAVDLSRATSVSVGTSDRTGISVRMLLPWVVGLGASATNMTAGTSATLTATVNQTVGATPYYIAILESDGTFVTSCGSGTTCSTTVMSSAVASQTYHAVVGSSAGKSPVKTSNSVTVKWGPGAATHLTVGTFNPFPAGSTHSVTVTARDAYGNVAVGYRGTIHFTSSDTKATLPADYTFTAADAGVHKFPNTLSPGLTLKTAGSQWVRATDKTTASITGSQTVSVTPGAAKTLSVSVGINPYPAGSTHSVTVTARDAYGNVATGYRGAIHFTSSDAKAVVPADYTFTAADAGVHTFPNTLSPGLTLKTAGSQWVRATDKTTASITGSQTVTVTPAKATHFSVGTYNPYPAGVSHSVTVKAFDAYGNVATGYLGTIHFTSSDKKATLPADYTFTSADKGVHTFTAALVLKTAGSQWVRATDKTTASITGSQTVTVT